MTCMKALYNKASRGKNQLEHQARSLALMGVSDENIAWFFGISLEELAMLAWHYESFFNAITPSQEETDAHKERISHRRTARNAKNRARLNGSISARIRNAIGARLWAALKGRSDGRLFSRLGYSADELISHLESRFQDGMTWENFGKWHVDHIKPCAMFDHNDPKQFAECWALTNLQPLWASDNIRKGARYAGT